MSCCCYICSTYGPVEWHQYFTPSFFTQESCRGTVLVKLLDTELSHVRVKINKHHDVLALPDKSEAILPTFTMEDELVIEGYELSEGKDKHLCVGKLVYPIAQIDFNQTDAVLTLQSVFGLDIPIPTIRVKFLYELIRKEADVPATATYAIYRKTFLPGCDDKFNLEIAGSEFQYSTPVKDDSFEKPIWHFECLATNETNLEFRFEQHKKVGTYKTLQKTHELDLTTLSHVPYPIKIDAPSASISAPIYFYVQRLYSDFIDYPHATIRVEFPTMWNLFLNNYREVDVNLKSKIRQKKRCTGMKLD